MTTDAAELRVLIVANDSLARAGLATMLAGQLEIGVSGQVSSGSGLAAAVEVYLPDVVVWDLGWDPDTFAENLDDLPEPRPPIVALLPDKSVTSAVWIAGARGLLLREISAERLGAAIRAAAQGLSVLDATLVEELQSPDDLPPSSLAEELTPRELQVLQPLAEGLSNKAIAFQLGISEHTVKFHVNAIMSKLGAQSRTEAAVRATRMGLILL